MASFRKKRNVAKSLTTLFDKAALQRLNIKEDSKEDVLERFFKSISPNYNQSNLASSVRRKRRKTEPPRYYSKLDISKESGVDQFVYTEDQAMRVSVSLPKLPVETVDAEKCKDTSPADRSMQASTFRSSLKVHEPSSQSPERDDVQKKYDSVIDAVIEKAAAGTLSRADEADESFEKSPAVSSKPEKNKPPLSKSSPEIDEDSASVDSNCVGTNRDSEALFEKKKTVSSEALNNNGRIEAMKFLKVQMKNLKDPVIFGGVVKHKFDLKLKSSKCERSHIPQSVLNQVVARYNRKLLNYHHKHFQETEARQKKAASLLAEMTDARSDDLSGDYWRAASRNRNFPCPRVLPPQMNVTRDQFSDFLECTSDIEALQADRREKLDRIQCLHSLLDHLKALKKDSQRYAHEKCANLLSARLRSSQLRSALNDARTLAEAFSTLPQGK